MDRRIWGALLSYRRGVSAATAIEYTLMVAGIALAIVASVFVFGDSVLELFLTVDNAFQENL